MFLIFRGRQQRYDRVFLNLYQQEKKYAELQALQDENLRNDQMEITLNNNRAIAGAAGILDDSRSFLEIQQDVRNNAVKDIKNIRLNKNHIPLGFTSLFIN